MNFYLYKIYKKCNNANWSLVTFHEHWNEMS